jgi:hypothetical protein
MFVRNVVWHIYFPLREIDSGASTSEAVGIRKIQGLDGRSVVVGREHYPESIPDEEMKASRELMMSEVPYGQHPENPEGYVVPIVRGPLAGIRSRKMPEESDTFVIAGVALIRSEARVKVLGSEVSRSWKPIGAMDAVAGAHRM